MEELNFELMKIFHSKLICSSINDVVSRIFVTEDICQDKCLVSEN